jgi:hypothetical protein
MDPIGRSFDSESLFIRRKDMPGLKRLQLPEYFLYILFRNFMDDFFDLRGLKGKDRGTG